MSDSILLNLSYPQEKVFLNNELFLQTIFLPSSPSSQTVQCEDIFQATADLITY